MTTDLPSGGAAGMAGVRADFLRIGPEHIERLGWDGERLHAYRTSRLREVLEAAIAGSPYHARRLAHIDPSTFELADLPSLPVMTKTEMMAQFDDVVTDRRLTRAGIEAHLAGIGEQPELYLDDYLILVSGGSSGLRGMYAYHRADLAEYLAGIVRGGMAKVAAMVGWPPPEPIPTAVVAAPTAAHATRATVAVMEGTVAAVTYAPVTMPFDTIVDLVQQTQPLLLAGYATMIARLADAQRMGRLSITPLMVLVSSEQLTPDLSQRITAGFGAPPGNGFGSSEGLQGSAPPGSDVFDFASDLAIVEFVDAHDRPVPPSTTADHVLVTNLFNRVQPLIRFRLDDRMTEAPPSNEHGHQRARVEGRTDDIVRIADTDVHPLTFRTAMLSFPDIAEYQVRIGDDVVIDVVPTDGRAPDLEHIERKVAGVLHDAGAHVRIEARTVDAVERDPRTGKTRRFLTV